MSSRYLSNLAFVVAGGFLAVATQAFSPASVAWLTFGVATGLTIVSIYIAAAGPGVAQRLAGGAAAILGAWTIVASLVFAPTTVLWLGLASAIAFVAVGIVGLTIHELSDERVLHSLKVDGERRPARQPRSNGKAVAA